ncbi:hypothetical protein Clacol_004937 [Clathrus columnatus]|uniref:Uncharacterized protein n=1 Tax=Clathrus columnatus TaxID=1419009 RepID=A0AAV5A8T0_9AGAM|nr:hypothetical protein Clacol_004937 [Clathrus columnatus]
MIVSLVKQGLEKNIEKKKGLTMLSDTVIIAIFDTRPSVLWGLSNIVAHEATEDDIAEVVLDSGLSKSNRKKAIELFVWLNGRQPSLPVKSYVD